MQCPDDVYEMLKYGRYEYNEILKKIKKIEKEMDEIINEKPITAETNIRVEARKMRLQNLLNRKKLLNEFIKKYETQCFIIK